MLRLGRTSPHLCLWATMICQTLLAEPSPTRGENWATWRGSEQNGISRETGVPLTWSETSGQAWKCSLPAWGNSSAVIWGDAIFVTSHVEDRDLVLLRINKQTGQLVWKRQVGTAPAVRTPLAGKPDEARRHQKFHATQTLASPSCVTDGELVITHFGNGDLAAYDFAGQQLWHRNLQQDHGEYNIWWGHANSPVLYRDLVISVCMQDSCRDLPGEPSPSYVVAHHKRTGERVWLTMRPTSATSESCDSYTTPLLQLRGTRMEMLIWGGQVLDAYDPATGRRLWRLAGLEGNRVIPSPVVAGDLVFVTQGMRRPMLAVKRDGKEDRSPADVVWKYDGATSDSPSPVVWGELLFFTTNEGFATCLNARTGAVLWKERLKGQYRASPVAAEGRVYFLSTDGLTTVVAAAAEFKRLAENKLDDETIASPAVSDGRIFIRGRKNLYCLTGSPQPGK